MLVQSISPMQINTTYHRALLSLINKYLVTPCLRRQGHRLVIIYRNRTYSIQLYRNSMGKERGIIMTSVA